MRQLLDEADRVRHQYAGPGLRLKGAHGGVERREKLVLHQHLATGKGPHQGRLARVGVADQRDPKLVAAARTMGIRRDVILRKVVLPAALPSITVGFRLAFAAAWAAIIAAVVGLAGSLELRVNAEGCETAEQLEQLKALGCDEVQGWFHGRPEPSALIVQSLLEQRERAPRETAAA